MIDKENFFAFKNYLLDLDNTLIDEKQYLFAAYHKIALDNFLDYNEIINLFNKEGTKNLFNKILYRNNLPIVHLDSFLTTLRTIVLPFKLEIYPEVNSVLSQLTSLNKRIVIVTNGNIEQQINKMNQIEWNGLDKQINFELANLIAPKPSIELFNYLEEKYNLNKKETIIIGDSITDEEFATTSKICFQNVELILKGIK